ncbi:hypothetical protein V866_003445 [Kwoniella sp. B9012]
MLYRIGYVGLGNMGRPIFTNLANYAATNGLPAPCAWNIDQSSYREIQSDLKEVHLAGEVEEVIKRSNVVFTCLLNDEVAEKVYQKLYAAVGSEKVIFVDQSSLRPKTSRRLEKAAHAVGASYLAAPVFGRPNAAKAATLVQILGGEPEVKELVKPILVPAIATRTVDAGNEVAKGNSLILGIVEMLAETYAVADTIGFDAKVYQSFIRDFLPVYPYIAYGDNISTGSFKGAGGFRLEADARNILSLGEDFGKRVSMPTIELAKKHLERAEELCGEDVDWSALAVALREQAGLAPFR